MKMYEKHRNQLCCFMGLWYMLIIRNFILQFKEDLGGERKHKAPRLIND